MLDQRLPTDKPGLTGRALRVYLTTGKGLVEQIKDAQAARALAEVAHTTTPQEATMASKTTARKTARTRKDQAKQPQSKRTAARKGAAEGITSAEVARDNGIDPKAFRRFLRSAGIDRQFSTKAKGAAAVKKFVKAQADEKVAA